MIPDKALRRPASQSASTRAPTPWEVIIKTAVTHTVTYFVAGLGAFAFLDYQALFAGKGLAGLMRPVSHPLVMAGPLFQPIRGVLFGVVFYLLRSAFFGRTNGWLVMWAVLVSVGIVGTFGPSPGSLEGFVYTVVPSSVQLILLPEVLTQSLLLSWVVCQWVIEPTRTRSTRNKAIRSPGAGTGRRFHRPPDGPCWRLESWQINIQTLSDAMRLERGEPILPARNLDETRAFYVKLGFKPWWGATESPWEYEILSRGHFVVHFYLDSNLSPNRNETSCYWRVRDADRLYEEFSAVNLPSEGIPRVTVPADEPWGMREFALVDPSGNRLRVGHDLDPDTAYVPDDDVV